MDERCCFKEKDSSLMKKNKCYITIHNADTQDILAYFLKRVAKFKALAYFLKRVASSKLVVKR